jgi:hypothetical protein
MAFSNFLRKIPNLKSVQDGSVQTEEAMLHGGLGTASERLTVEGW